MWPFSSTSEAESSTAATSSTPSSPKATTGTPPSATPSKQTPTQTRWEKTLTDEEKYQERVYPSYEDVPACMTLMDEFLMCYALGPQLRNLYRHGTYRDCRYKWADFKYCLSMKSEDSETRRELWVKRRAEWWAKRRVGSSSEDVWEVRDKPLENFPPLFADDVPETPM